MTSKYTESGLLDELTLGKQTEYVSQYQPSLLQAVPRSLNREQLNLKESLPFYGADLWTGYEISWLNAKGKPVVAIGEFYVPYDSPNLVESKSFKLYLNSFNQTRFESWQAVQDAMAKDLSACAGRPVSVKLFNVDVENKFQIMATPGENIDDLDIDVDDYEFSPELLALESQEVVEESLNSHLLKSNCLITSQPDWASIVINYRGAKLNREALLRYLISFRMHNEFHEQCVERIFCDINQMCQPEYLSVYARYTRRGGLDINPFRSSDDETIVADLRTHRQ